MAEKIKLKAIKHAEKKFCKHMLSFDKKQNEEVEKLERIYDKEKAQLEKEYQVELAFVRSVHSHHPSIIDKLKRLEETFEVNSKEHSLEMEIRRQNLKKIHVAEKNIEEGVKVRLLEEVNSWLRKNVVSTYSHPSEGQSIDGDVPNMPNTASLHSGKKNVVLALDKIESKKIDETNTLALEKVAYAQPNGMESSLCSSRRIVVLALNKIKSKRIDETNTLALEKVAYTQPNGMESSLNSGERIVVLALNKIEIKKIDETSTLSLEKVPYAQPNGMESSLYSGRRIVVLALNKIESKRIDETNTLALEKAAHTQPNGMESSLNSGERIVVLALNKIEIKKIDETNTLSLEKVPYAQPNGMESSLYSGRRIVVLALNKIESKRIDETNILSLEKVAYTQQIDLESPGSPEKEIPDRDVVLEDKEISPDMPETAHDEVVNGSQFNRKQDGPSLVNSPSLTPAEGLSETLQLQDECFLLPQCLGIDVVSSDSHEAQYETTPTGSPLLLQTSTCTNSTPGVLTQVEIPFSCNATSFPSNQEVPLENVVQNQPNPPSECASPPCHTAIEGQTSIQPTGASLLRARTVVTDFSNRSILTTSAASVMASRMTHHTYFDSLQNETERIRREIEQTIKITEEAKLQLQSDCEKEIEEAIAEIGKKYETLAQDNEQQFQIKRQELDSNYKNVYMNKMLVEALRSKCMDLRIPGNQGLTHIGGPPVARPRSPALRRPLSSPSSTGLPVRPSYASVPHSVGPLASLTTPAPSRYVSVPRSIGTLASPAAPPRSAAPATHVQVAHNYVSPFSSSFNRLPPLHITTITPPSRNFQVGSGIRAPAPHLQSFRPSVSMPTISPLRPNSRPKLRSPSSANDPQQRPPGPESGTSLLDHLITIPNLPSLPELGTNFDPHLV